jgi:hypothetical protein
MHSVEKENATVLAMSAWDVRMSPPPQKPGVMVRLHLRDMRRSLSHAKSERVDRDRLGMKAFHDVSFASRLTRRALAQKRLKDIRLSNVGWARDCDKARRRERSTS